MQIKHLHKNIYKVNSCILEDRNREISQKLKEDVEKYEKLTQDKASKETKIICKCISKATYFRYKQKLKLIHKNLPLPSRRPHKLRESKITYDLKQLVLSIRKENPTYGKAKIAVILKRDHKETTSESSVGRIIKEFMEKKLIQKSISSRSKAGQRKFNKHSKRWKYGQKSTKPGELVQIDHMTTRVNDVTYKHFKAWDPVTKLIVAEVFKSASSISAREFLAKVLANMPFSVTSIQVDGGSEFMRHFEDECKNQNIQLYILPPRRPQWNGGVERGNRTFREEFYDSKELLSENLDELRPELAKAVEKYNNYRPHASLNGLTPCEYNHIIQGGCQSHMY